MIRAAELRKGKLVAHEGQYYNVHSSQHVAKGNKRSYMQVKLLSIKTGQMLDVRFGVDDRVETPFVDTKPYEYLYRDGDSYVMMDQTTYDQLHVPAALMGEADKFLKGNEIVVCSLIEGRVVATELPNTVELEVADTSPVAKGATATNQTKDATLETGYRVKVPPFIAIGEVLRIDTRTGEYLERAK